MWAKIDSSSRPIILTPIAPKGPPSFCATARIFRQRSEAICSNKTPGSFTASKENTPTSAFETGAKSLAGLNTGNQPPSNRPKGGDSVKNAIKAFVLVVMMFVFSAASFAQATPATPAKPATPPATEKKNETATEKSSSMSDDTGKTKSKAAKAKTKRTKKASEKSTEKMEEKKTDTMEKKTK